MTPQKLKPLQVRTARASVSTHQITERHDMPDFVTDPFAGTGGSLTGLPRRFLVSVHHNGATTYTSVTPDEDVLNIERDLHHHLNEFPYSDAWLEQLRDLCTSRLQARQAARACGGVSIPTEGGAKWGTASWSK